MVQETTVKKKPHVGRQVAVEVGKEGLKTLNRLAESKNVHLSGLFRMFVADVVAKHDGNVTCIDRPNFRISSKGKGKRRECKLFNSNFSSNLPKKELRRIYHRQRKEVEAQPDWKGVYTFSQWLRDELLTWLEGQGMTVEPAALHPGERVRV